MYDVQLVRTTLLTSTYHVPACTYNVQLIRMTYQVTTNTLVRHTNSYIRLTPSTYNFSLTLTSTVDSKYNEHSHSILLKHLSMLCQTIKSLHCSSKIVLSLRVIDCARGLCLWLCCGFALIFKQGEHSLSGWLAWARHTS